MKKERKSSAQKSAEILVVEDSLTQAAQIKHLLESHHYKVTVAHDGEGAISKLLKYKPALVISDILMPQMNGYELCKRIKFNKSTEDIPVILLTRLVDPEEIIEGLTCGADSFITKPFNEKYLLSHIEKILSEENGKNQKKVPFDVQILFKGKKRFIQAEQQNVIKLMLDIYEGAIHKNERLVKTEEELRLLNERLESLVEDRTSDLAAEIKLSNQIAERLKKSEERFRNLYNDAVVGLYRTNSQGEILLVNRAMLKMLGFQSFEELTARNIKEADYGPSYDRQQFIDQIEKEGELKDLEAIWICRDGKEIFVRENAKAIYDSEGKILYYDGSVEDITERKRTEEELIESETKYRQLVTKSPDGIFVIDLSGKFLSVNKAICDNLKYTEEELLSMKMQDIVPEKYHSLHKQRLMTILKGESPRGNAEYEVKGKDGISHFVEVLSVPYYKAKEIVGFQGIAHDITERKLREEELNKNQSQLMNALKIAHLGSWEYDVGKDIFIFNDLFYKIFRTTAEQVGGYTMKSADYANRFVHPEDIAVVGSETRKAIETDDLNYSRQLEHRIIYADGETGYITVRFFVVKNEKGKTVRTYGVNQDITERKLAEDNLRSSEERLKILFDYAPDAYYLNDLKGNFIDGNIAAEKLMGYNRNDLLGKSFLKLKLLSLKQIPRAAKLLVKNALGQGTGPDEFVLNRKDGSKVTAEIVTHPVKIKGHTLVLGLARDITERKKAEEELQQSFVFSESLLKTIPFGMDIVDEKGTVMFLNDSFKRVFGDKAIGGKCWELYRDNKKQCPNCPLIRGMTIGETETYESHGVFGNRIFEINHTSMMYKGKKAMLEIFQDITDRKGKEEELIRAKEKAEKSDRLKTTFLNNISHEVRTPLNGILGFAEIMSQPDDLSEEEKKLSHSMLLESSDRLLNTITNYMDISLIASGNMIVNKKDIVPGQIIKELLGKYMTICSGRKLELLLKLPEHSDELSINSDPEILSKVVSHLLSNAIKFTEEGSIQYGYTIGKNELEFFVKDTGIGIAKESLKDVFERFIKEDRGPIKITEGSGLGLSISKGLVVLLGGKICVESEKGKGSCFYFTIPVEKKIEDYIIIPTAGKQTTNVETNSILVAEDDEVNFFFLRALLKQNTSAEIIHASNGKEAIDKFKENPNIGLVLMDIKMPVMDGLEATRQIKAINRNIPIIAITAYAMPGDENRITEAGCDYYLNKPINKKLLLDKMAEFISL